MTHHLKALTALGVLLAATAAAPAGVLTLDFETDAAGNPIQPGQFIDDEYAAWGVSISAQNNRGPDAAITFDSANPTGGDPDLATPGYHASNDRALGNILIIAEDVRDRNNDGYVDDPDDQAGRNPGYFSFLFDAPQYFGEATMVDIEEGGSVELFNYDFQTQSYTPVQTYAVAGQADNAMQTVSFMPGESFNAVRINMSGSGAVGELSVGGGTVIPEPASVSLIGLGLFMMLPRRKRR
jgi:hypothetical protein